MLGCFGFGLMLMKTSSCSMSAVIHWGSTSMSSLMSNINTRGKQPCGAKHKIKVVLCQLQANNLSEPAWYSIT